MPLSLSFSLPKQVFLAVLSLASCEPPRLTYGAPSYPSGWDTSSVSSSSSAYVSQPLYHQTSEGLHIDQQLLNTVKEVILSSENSGSSQSIKSVYGPPSHWSNRVVGIDFGHPVQSPPVAYYLGKTYAPAEWSGQLSSGYVSGSSGSVQFTSPPRPSTTYGIPSGAQW
jgi:hypothetical protein